MLNIKTKLETLIDRRRYTFVNGKDDKKKIPPPPHQLKQTTDK